MITIRLPTLLQWLSASATAVLPVPSADIEREAGIRRRGLSDPDEDGISPGAFARRQDRHHLGRGLAIEIERRGLGVRRTRIGDAYKVRILATVAIERPGGKSHRVGRAGERTEHGFVVVLAMN